MFPGCRHSLAWISSGAWDFLRIFQFLIDILFSCSFIFFTLFPHSLSRIEHQSYSNIWISEGYKLVPQHEGWNGFDEPDSRAIIPTENGLFYFHHFALSLFSAFAHLAILPRCWIIFTQSRKNSFALMGHDTSHHACHSWWPHAVFLLLVWFIVALLKAATKKRPIVPREGRKFSFPIFFFSNFFSYEYLTLGRSHHSSLRECEKEREINAFTTAPKPPQSPYPHWCAWLMIILSRTLDIQRVRALSRHNPRITTR